MEIKEEDLTTIEKKLKAFADLKVQEKKISELLDRIKPDIRKYLLDTGVDKLPTTAGTFSISERTTWQYSKAVESLQKEEKANGTAKAVKSVILLFKAPGGEEE